MTTLNASTSSGLIAGGNTDGTIQLQSNGTNIATISSSGLTMNSGNIVQATSAAPTFSAYQNNGGQSISAGVATKVIIDTKEFDTASCFNTSTYRYTPNVAGYYQLNWYTAMGAYNSRYTSYLYKNGSVYKGGADIIGNGVNTAGTGGSSVVYANGSTDYFEIYVQGNNSATTGGASTSTYFNGSFIRSA